MRVLVISDIHANRAALEAVLEDAGQIGFDAAWCLGDIVGYGPEPDWCVNRIRHLDAAVGLTAIVGNHDWAALERMEVDDFNPEAARTVVWTRKHLSDESLAWLGDLPKDPIVEEGRFTLAHGSPRDSVWEYILDPFIAGENFRAEEFTSAFCLVGHTHVPVIVAQKGRTLPPPERFALRPGVRYLINPGSVGQPRDRVPLASFGVLDEGEQVYEHYRVPYPIEKTQGKILDAGLPRALADRLAEGW